MANFGTGNPFDRIRVRSVESASGRYLAAILVLSWVRIALASMWIGPIGNRELQKLDCRLVLRRHHRFEGALSGVNRSPENLA